MAVPNDASNQARALVLLQSAGLVELKSGGSIFSDLADIDTEASRVQVEALDAALTATSLDDLAGAVVNNDFVERAGLDFDDALAQDDPDDTKALPYAIPFPVTEARIENLMAFVKTLKVRDVNQVPVVGEFGRKRQLDQ